MCICVWRDWQSYLRCHNGAQDLPGFRNKGSVNAHQGTGASALISNTPVTQVAHTAGRGMNVPHVTYFYIILLERVE